jgi:hypothetical protein
VFVNKLFGFFRQQEMLQRSREELDRERRNLVRRRPTYEVKEKPTKTSYTRAKSKDRGGLFVVNDESSNDGMKTTSDANKALVYQKIFLMKKFFFFFCLE